MKVSEAIENSRIGIAVWWWETGNNDIPYYTSRLTEHAMIERLASNGIQTYANTQSGYLFCSPTRAKIKSDDWYPVCPMTLLERVAKAGVECCWEEP